MRRMRVTHLENHSFHSGMDMGTWTTLNYALASQPSPFLSLVGSLANRPTFGLKLKRQIALNLSIFMFFIFILLFSLFHYQNFV